MKQLKVLSVGLIALGLCTVNAGNLNNINYTSRCIVDDQQEVEVQLDDPAATPAQKAMKGNPPADDTSGSAEADTSDMNNDETTDNEED